MQKILNLFPPSRIIHDHPSLILSPSSDGVCLHLIDGSSSDIRNTMNADDFRLGNLLISGNRNLVNPLFLSASGLEESDNLVSQAESLSNFSKSLISN